MMRLCALAALVALSLVVFGIGCTGTSGPGDAGAEMRSVSFNLTLGGEQAEVSSRNWNYDYGRQVQRQENYAPQDDPDHVWAKVRDDIAQTENVDLDGDGIMDGAVVLGNDHFARRKLDGDDGNSATHDYEVYYFVFFRNELPETMWLPTVDITWVEGGTYTDDDPADSYQWQWEAVTPTIRYYDHANEASSVISQAWDYSRSVPAGTGLHGPQGVIPSGATTRDYSGVKALNFLDATWSDKVGTSYVPLEREWRFRLEDSLLTESQAQMAWTGGFACDATLSWYTSDPGTP